MRERWYGATGRRVPELALEGTLDVEGALVLDDVADVGRLRAAHADGTPVVVRAGRPRRSALRSPARRWPRCSSRPRRYSRSI